MHAHCQNVICAKLSGVDGGHAACQWSGKTFPASWNLSRLPEDLANPKWRMSWGLMDKAGG